jgi:hypothetical protein
MAVTRGCAAVPPPSVPRASSRDEPWRVRIRDGAGQVRGAGFLVATGQVLTCAHVVCSEASGPAPTDTVSVEFVSLPATPAVTARVASGGWVPVHQDNTGDIAVLDLELPAPARARARPAPLRRLVGWGRLVHAFGFPSGAHEYGVNAVPTVSGPGGPGGEWVQLDSPSDDRRITGGFSGAAVVDHQTGAVIGMVVMEYVRDQPAVSWMIPVETIVRHLRHLPDIVGCVAGNAAVDKELTANVGNLGDPAPSQEFGLWFRRAGRPVRLVVTGDESSRRSSGLRRMILLADRELRPEVAHEAVDVVPPVGGVDLAVDATGKTVADLRRRIRERFAPDGAAGPLPPVTIVVDGTDDAAAPEQLLRDVLKPLADDGARLLLGFRRKSSPAWAIATSLWPGQDQPDDHPDVLRTRVTELTARIHELVKREDLLNDHQASVARRVRGAPQSSPRGLRLAWRVSVLRGVPVLDPAVVARTELAVERAGRRVEVVRRELDALLERRRELRARLEGYHAMAIAQGLAEDSRLDPVYRQAHAELHRHPTDLAVAAELVDAYRALIEGGRP